MASNRGNLVTNVLQVLAAFCIAGIFVVILHKGYRDISALAQNYTGNEFWFRLVRYLIANLAGG